jgi:hypothetical protein
MSNLTIGAVVAFSIEGSPIEVGCVETIYKKSGNSLIEWYSDEDGKWFHAYANNKEAVVLESKSVKQKGYIL